MRAFYTRSQVHSWSLADLQDLVGKYVVVEIPASEEQIRKEGCGYWVGGSGVVKAAGRRDEDPSRNDVEFGAVTWVLWDYGMGWSWTKDAWIYVSVCDGDDHDVSHNTFTAATCLPTLGIRNRIPYQALAEFGE